MAIETLSPRDVTGTLSYFAGKDAYYYVGEPPAGVPRSNIEENLRPYEVTIHDTRGKEDAFSLDTTGFAFVRLPSEEREFKDEEAIRGGYYKEIEELLKAQTGAKRVFVFDHTVRRPPTPESLADKSYRGPSRWVHGDQTTQAAIHRVYDHMGADADRLIKGRWRIINVWRPIENPVAHDPLVLGDWRTLNTATDIAPMRLIYPHKVGGTLTVRYSAAHRFHYLSGQTPDEVTLIKCFDSQDGVARLAPHTSFKDKTSPSDAPQRQSIEVRALVFDLE